MVESGVYGRPIVNTRPLGEQDKGAQMTTVCSWCRGWPRWGPAAGGGDVKMETSQHALVSS